MGKFPLILVVGREPNNHLPFCDYVGTYDFRLAPHCSFWNIAYKIVADTQNTTVRELKDTCYIKNSSILAFTDLSPKPIPNQVKNKRIEREEASDKAFEHIGKIFSKDMISRVEFVILSGVEELEFVESLRFFKEKCESKNISTVNLPFFFPTNYPKIKEKITEDTSTKINYIYSKWLDA